MTNSVSLGGSYHIIHIQVKREFSDLLFLLPPVADYPDQTIQISLKTVSGMNVQFDLI